MTKLQFLNTDDAGLLKWFSEFEIEVTDNELISQKLRDYLFRQINRETIRDPALFFKKRATVIMYLGDAVDFTENPAYGEEECDQAIALLTPDDFDADKDCLFCLKSFPAREELQAHYEHCST